ncbi:hypothetical protein E2562_019114 [Oryza meyeriana var. granulata]|uniref:Uncharacterized protein n=1 Tax=Oryza meyeriana var. granulata TaxID=110450 RepID=A0A6G1CQ99_9ORYZ|nr:hypothetical protein E2562_019114 [Oryza meyeriana var. granulata]
MQLAEQGQSTLAAWEPTRGSVPDSGTTTRGCSTWLGAVHGRLLGADMWQHARLGEIHKGPLGSQCVAACLARGCPRGLYGS